MKKLIYLFSLILLFNCTETPSSPEAIAEKKIYQKVDVDGMGMLEDLKILEVKMVDATSFEGTHAFYNPMTKREMKITRVYTFSENLDSIVSKEEVSIYIKSDGEWVKW